MAEAPPPAAPDAVAPTTRASSLWPQSTQPLGSHSTQQLSRFDPLLDERARERQRMLAAFDVCHPALALRALVGVQLVLALGALCSATSWAELPARLAHGAFAGVAAVLLWLVALCASRGLLARAHGLWRVMAVLGLGAGAAWAAWWPLELLGLAGEAGEPRTLAVPLLGAALAAVLWAWLALRVDIWQPAQSHARLIELQSRIRPHFLFNALNTALALVRVDPEKAESVLEDLSELFRVALADAGISVSLAEEVALARRYLAIEQIRFGTRLQVHWAIDGACDAARVPPLMLQPLVENAVRHGIEPASAGGRVEIHTALRRGQVVLEIINTLPDDDEVDTPGNGMALANVRERLRLLHDVAAQCDTWREGEGRAARFHVRVIVPR